MNMGAIPGSHASHGACSTSPPVGFDPARMSMFLEILSAMGGTSNASDYAENWINAFCEDHEKRDPDTFNQAIDAGYVEWSHDSDSDHSTIRLTDKGRAASVDRSGEAGETTKIGSTEGESAVAESETPVTSWTAPTAGEVEQTAENALLMLGGRAVAVDVKDKITCPHCGFGLSETAAERLIQHGIDQGTIIVEKDWSLSLASKADARPERKTDARS